MTQAPRMTLQTQLVLRAMLAEPTAERYGLELCEQTGLPSGTILTEDGAERARDALARAYRPKKRRRVDIGAPVPGLSRMSP